ncbi:Ig-like domain-containing protein [Demequina gelatinilytica]|uniref:Ig-like domain-containing protein n=1 Tax=Demequina gelatinilytica TaxID=1638980 RepID=UPI000784B141|nr:Ig-like domain-containing protein [Demequina gelatinilytica]
MTEPAVGRYSAARRARAWRIGGGAACLALAAGVVLGPDFDQREVESEEPGVWILKGDGEHAQYGRVNTTLGELDTYRAVANPSGLVQSGSQVLMFAEHNSLVTVLAPGRAVDIVAGEGAATSAGTGEVVHAGDYFAYIGSDGSVRGGRVSDGTGIASIVLDPYSAVDTADGEATATFSADAVALRSDGSLAALSRSGDVVEGSLATGDADGGATLTRTEIEPTGEDLAMSFAGDRYVVWDPAAAQLWVEDQPRPVSIPVEDDDALLQAAPTDDGTVAIADSFGVIRVDLETMSAEHAFGPESTELGIVSAPLEVDGELTVAWLAKGGAGGLLWRDGEGRIPLDYAGGTLTDTPRTAIQSNGTRAVVNDTVSGWAWDAVDGTPVASSQQWAQDSLQQDDTSTAEATPEVQEQRPPTAEDDDFGVRAGRQVRLPVLLNDHDPNGDPLAIVPGTLEGLQQDFGTVAIADDGQAIVATIAADATGSATFTYGISDGTAAGSGAGAVATVTLTVHDEDQNGAPQWCGDDPGCLAEEPGGSVAVGGSTRIDALTGWVDPDGDPIYLSDAATDSPSANAVAASDGTVVFTHQDPQAEAAPATVDLQVADVHGASTPMTITVSVEGSPRLTAETLTVQRATGPRQSIDISEAVSGAQGPLTMTEVEADDANVAIATDVVGFTFSAEEEGSYTVTYVVGDGSAEVTGYVRVDVVPRDEAEFSTVPLTAFVRDGEDVTVDVVGSATNPAGLVLVVEDPQPDVADEAVSAQSGRASDLRASAVGLSSLRLSGSTGDGEPGLIGTVRYTLSDGAGTAVTGEVAVVMVDSSGAPAPAVVDDAYTVRAGTQVDFSVLKNDAGAPGTVVTLAAGSVSAGDDSGLAFTSGRVVRYLAPETPGTYSFTYDAYPIGYPEQVSTATVVVEVKGTEINTAPTPADVTARANLGLSVTIPIAAGGQDPDGDPIRIVGIKEAPAKGAAEVSADGRSLVYTAATDASGQFEFTFIVEDAARAQAVATAHIGVAEGQVAPAPITFTDYVQVQVGEGHQVVLDPVANDTDPLGEELALVEITPDEVAESDAYEALAARISRAEDSDLITISAGDEPTTYSYLYKVRSASGSESYGRVVVKVVRDAIPDVPVLEDTVLAFEDRETFETGVDVVTGRAAWASGDVAALTVTPYEREEDVQATGRSLQGPLPQDTRTVVFKVSGADFEGEESFTYGFLTVPGIDDFVPRLNATLEPVQVKEGEKVAFDLGTMVAVPDGEVLEILPTSVRTTAARSEARCEARQGLGLTYDAGWGAPYSDGCVVGARLVGQDEYTLLTVPIVVEPVDPLPSLTSTALEISPGDTQTVDLGEMVAWDNVVGRDVTLRASTRGGESFDVVQNGMQLTITTHDDARPGQESDVALTATSHDGVQPGGIHLTVGPAPTELPKGATVKIDCRADDPQSCAASVIDGPGEVNPLPTTALTLVDVVSTGDCAAASFTQDGDRVRMSWAEDMPGGTCTASFTVQDAQGRASSGARNGTVIVDFSGYPAAPASLSQVGYGDGTIVFAVKPGKKAYPPVTGFEVQRDGRTVATCDTSGACTEVDGLTNGAEATYTAVAVNAIGTSRSSTAGIVAWAYLPPAAVGTVTWEPSGDGTVSGTVGGIDPSTAQLTLRGSWGEKVIGVTGTTARFTDLSIGSNTSTAVEITPASRFPVPAGAGPTDVDTTTVQMNGVGAPVLAVKRDSDGADDGSAEFTVTLTGGGDDATLLYGYTADGKKCVAETAGSGTVTVPVDIERNEVNQVIFCALSRWGTRTYGEATWTSDEWLPVSSGKPALGSFSWGVSCTTGSCTTVDGGTGSGGQSPVDSGSAPGGFSLYWFVGGVNTGEKSFPWYAVDEGRSVTAAYCKRQWGQLFCSGQSNATTAAVLNGGSETRFSFSLAGSLVQQSEAVPADPEDPESVASPATYLLRWATEGTVPASATVSVPRYSDGLPGDPTTEAFALPEGDVTVTIDVAFAGGRTATLSTICYP